MQNPATNYRSVTIPLASPIIGGTLSSGDAPDPAADRDFESPPSLSPPPPTELADAPASLGHLTYFESTATAATENAPVNYHLDPHFYASYVSRGFSLGIFITCTATSTRNFFTTLNSYWYKFDVFMLHFFYLWNLPFFYNQFFLSIYTLHLR